MIVPDSGAGVDLDLGRLKFTYITAFGVAPVALFFFLSLLLLGITPAPKSLPDRVLNVQTLRVRSEMDEQQRGRLHQCHLRHYCSC